MEMFGQLIQSTNNLQQITPGEAFAYFKDNGHSKSVYLYS